MMRPRQATTRPGGLRYGRDNGLRYGRPERWACGYARGMRLRVGRAAACGVCGCAWGVRLRTHAWPSQGESRDTKLCIVAEGQPCVAIKCS